MLLAGEAVSVDTVPSAGNAVLLVVLADIGEGPVGELAMIRWPADCTNVCSAKVNVFADRAEAPGKVNVEDPRLAECFQHRPRWLPTEKSKFRWSLQSLARPAKTASRPRLLSSGHLECVSILAALNLVRLAV